MANKCLQTKLKSVVDNDNLSKLGCISIIKKSVQSGFSVNLWFNIRSNAQFDATSRDSVFLDNAGASLGNTITVPVRTEWDFPIRFGLGTGKFDIPKYSLLWIKTSYNQSDFEIKISDLQNIENLKEIELPLHGSLSDIKGLGNLTSFVAKSESTIYGDIANFAKCPKLSKISVSSPVSEQSVYGDIKDLGTLTSLTNIKFSAGSIGLSGSIEDFVHEQRNATTPRVSCDGMTVNIFGSRVTFNGSNISAYADRTLSWTASTITYNGVTIEA